MRPGQQKGAIRPPLLPPICAKPCPAPDCIPLYGPRLRCGPEGRLHAASSGNHGAALFHGSSSGGRYPSGPSSQPRTDTWLPICILMASFGKIADHMGAVSTLRGSARQTSRKIPTRIQPLPVRNHHAGRIGVQSCISRIFRNPAAIPGQFQTTGRYAAGALRPSSPWSRSASVRGGRAQPGRCPIAGGSDRPGRRHGRWPFGPCWSARRRQACLPAPKPSGRR